MLDEIEKDVVPEISSLKQLQSELDDAVKNEDFEKALKLKSEIEKLDS
jgi:protein-arginine kinase activator protein McsA